MKIILLTFILVSITACYDITMKTAFEITRSQIQSRAEIKNLDDFKRKLNSLKELEEHYKIDKANAGLIIAIEDLKHYQKYLEEFIYEFQAPMILRGKTKDVLVSRDLPVYKQMKNKRELLGRLVRNAGQSIKEGS